MSEPKPKSFAISKWAVWEAYRRVKANKGAAGVDEQSIEEFERDLKGNLYKLWNRLSSGSYFPPPVRAVEIPKQGRRPESARGADRRGPDRPDGRALYLEPAVEPVFHPDSYGYRPGRSALDAVGVCRERCWRNDWVIDLDIRAFFDTVPQDLVLQGGRSPHRPALDPAVRGAVAQSAAATRGRHAGRAGSRNPSGVGDLALAGQHVHALRVRRVDGPGASGASRSSATAMTWLSTARSERQALHVRAAIATRLAECGLELNRAQDPHRVLQGRGPARLSRAHVVRRSWGTRSARGCRGTGSGSIS